MNRLITVDNAAVRTEQGTIYQLPKPNRHHNVLRYMHDIGHTRSELARSTQGFVLSNGIFVGRKEARKVAENAGQLLDDAYNLNELFSEDVW